MVRLRKKASSSKSALPQYRLEFDDELFIGIDLSMSDTGIVVLHDDHSVVRAFSLKTTVKHGHDDTRLAIIVDEIMKLVIEYASCNKVYVIMEAIPFSRRATGKVFTRYGIFSTLKYLLRKEGIDTYVVGATTLKNKFAGKGTADKEAIMNAIFTRYQLVIKNNNVADAFACAAIGIAHLRNKLKLSIEKIPLA